MPSRALRLELIIRRQKFSKEMLFIRVELYIAISLGLWRNVNRNLLRSHRRRALGGSNGCDGLGEIPSMTVLSSTNSGSASSSTSSSGGEGFLHLRWTFSRSRQVRACHRLVR